MNIVRIDKDNMLNGEGIRAVVWVSGCCHHCKNCHNPETWDPEYGHKITDKDINYLYSLLSKDYISGVTFTGGDPFYQSNIDKVLRLCKSIRKKFPDKNIWVYTGYTIEELNKKGYSNEFLSKYIDVLVDGEFKEDLKDFNYHWAGSTNQKIIKLNK